MQYSLRTSLLIKLLALITFVISISLTVHLYITHEYIKNNISSELSISIKDKQTLAKLNSINFQLQKDIFAGVFWLSFLSIIIINTLIWLALKREMRSILKISKAVQHRGLHELKPITLDHVPIEIKPLVEELNRLFFRLHEAFLREERFASDAAHELRTPLAALRAHTQVALRAENGKDLHHALHRIDEGIERCTHVISQLSTLSRATRLHVETAKFEPVILSHIAASIIADLFPLTKPNSIEIELKVLSKPEAKIFGNAISIGILIRNLVDNAIRYSNKNGKVTVIVDQDDHHVFLKVIDDGPGIPENMRDKVFERFFRIADSTIQGSGLGLSIVQQIAKSHHATINLATPESRQGLEIDVVFKKV